MPSLIIEGKVPPFLGMSSVWNALRHIFVPPAVQSSMSCQNSGSLPYGYVTKYVAVVAEVPRYLECWYQLFVAFFSAPVLSMLNRAKGT